MIAHINEQNEIETVMEHCLKTAALASKTGEQCGLKNLAEVTAYLHDMGKYTEEFKKYITTVTSEQGIWKQEKLNHSSAGGKYIEEEYAATASVFFKATIQIAAWSIFSHHGINNMVTVEKENYYAQRISPEKEIYFEEAKTNFLNNSDWNIKSILDDATKEVKNKIEIINTNMKGNENREFLLGLLARLNLSILVDSDRTATARFMGNGNVEYKHGNQELWGKLQQQLEHVIHGFTDTSELNKLRKLISNDCFIAGKKKTGIYNLQVPTGGGKTLASMRFALKHAIEHGKKRIFYIAPYKSILEQNAKVYKDIFGNEHILEYHSDVVVEEENDQYKSYTENFQVPIVLTTMVQFLNTFFSGKMQCVRRMQSFADSIIILDEVQSIPVHMTNLFNGCLNFLKYCCNSTILLCSATQPLFAETEKPLKLDGDLITIKKENILKFRRNNIVDKTTTIKTSSQIAAFTLQLMESDRSGIIISNTKQSAEEIFEKIKDYNIENLHLFYLSTNMCPKHRMDILENFKCLLTQAKTNENIKAICVSTQLLEAGVDISADFVIRTLAGWDSITQAAGRCNRNAERVMGKVYVVTCESENLSHLISIRDASKKAERVLDEFSRAAEVFDYDLLSQKTIELYYQYYFTEQMNNMDYEISNLDTSIMDMLSDFGGGYPKCKDLILKQAFKEAGKRFKAIDENTRGIIVPYHDGCKIIEKLNNKVYENEIWKLLKQAQSYTINVYEDKFNDLVKKGIVRKLFSCDGYYLNEDCFDNQLGIKKASELKELIF